MIYHIRRMGSAANPKSSVRQARVAEREAKLASFGGFRDKNVEAFATSLPGNLPAIFPNQFFDPLRFCADIPEGKLCFYREVELKHGRVGMLASLGFLVGESFHPLFGGDIDVPSYLAFQQTPLQTFWPAVVAAIAIPEIYSVFTFNNPNNEADNMVDQYGDARWTMKTDRESGDLGFDPLGLKPTDPEELKQMKTKELNNGRLAMIAAAGMVAQELVSGTKLLA
jgi:light-harvesting complex I chlorophyll a/b binding protein 4